jgi:hypothetical protein
MYKQQRESVKPYFAGFNLGGLESRAFAAEFIMLFHVDPQTGQV